QVPQLGKFAHERFVNLQAAGSVENERVAIVGVSKIECFATDFQDVRLSAFDEGGDSQFLTERFELVRSRGAVNVRRDKQWGATLLLQQAREFATGSGFAGTVEANHHQASGIP